MHSIWQIYNNLRPESHLLFAYCLGTNDKQILGFILEKYPNESREAFYTYLKVSPFILVSFCMRTIFFEIPSCKIL